MMNAFEGTGTFSALEADEPFPGVARQTFSTEQTTVSRYRFNPQAAFPLHSHSHEQVTLIEDGSVEVVLGGERSTLEAGDFCVMRSGVEHGMTAGSGGARIIAVVVPRRRARDEYTISGEQQ